MTDRKCHNMPTAPVDTSRKLYCKTSMVRCQGPSSSLKLCIFQYNMCIYINTLQCIFILEEIYCRYLTFDIFRNCQELLGYAFQHNPASGWGGNELRGELMHGPCDIHPETFWGQQATEQQKTTTTTTTVGETSSVSPVWPILESENHCFTWS